MRSEDEVKRQLPTIIGELLQRMNDLEARCRIAVPDLKQFRGLWQRLPSMAKTRTGITAFIVKASGEIDECLT